MLYKKRNKILILICLIKLKLIYKKLKAIKKILKVQNNFIKLKVKNNE